MRKERLKNGKAERAYLTGPRGVPSGATIRMFRLQGNGGSGVTAPARFLANSAHALRVLNASRCACQAHVKMAGAWLLITLLRLQVPLLTSKSLVDREKRVKRRTRR